jgi:hypothetical protein
VALVALQPHSALVVYPGAIHGRSWRGCDRRTLRLDTGDLAALVHDRKENVLGWAPVPVAGGRVVSMTATTDLDSGQRQLTLCVRRTLNGATVHTIEDMALPWINKGNADPAQAVLLFNAASFLAPDPFTSVAVPHLAGQQVTAWTNSGNIGPLTVPASGLLELGQPVTRALVGLFDATHEVETLDSVAATQAGDSRGRRKRIPSSVGVQVQDTVDLMLNGVLRSLGRAPIAEGARSIFERPILEDIITQHTGTTQLPLNTGSAPEISISARPVGGAQ